MKHWYVIQVYAGYENIVKIDIEKRVKQEGLQDCFGQVLVPATQTNKGVALPKQKDEQLLPGYVLIEMELNHETMRLVTSSMRVLRFLGGKEPTPLSKKEIERIVGQVKGEIEVGPKKTDFSIGGEVDIADGPFAGFVGVIEEIDAENEKLTIMVSIFGRMTPVELGFHQVKR